jgi:2-polyprenyl-3-methyl-5-hydroxy-6-metoxy-1,4-benzoquinol methylase
VSRDYVHDFVTRDGHEYRKQFFAQQWRGGEHPLLVYPSPKELFSQLDKYNPRSVLEFGCGWGRMMEWLVDRYGNSIEIQGCDVCDELLVAAQFSGYGLDVFKLDIVKKSLNRQWDVLFCRGVFHYFTGQQMGNAIKNLLSMTNRRMLVWEFPHICGALSVTAKKFPDGGKIKIFPIPYKKEYWRET